MRILKKSTRSHPRLSLVLLDWGVRESFHLFHYLKNQTIPRDDFEIVLIEYYDGISEPAQQFEPEIDTWILLEMPAKCYYHKHMMYNAGIVFSRGEILMVGDSDAMVRPTFLQTILGAFEKDPGIAYHMDEFRNVRRDFYPFNYPSFEDVLGEGCINNIGGKTKGILDQSDPMHTRNYGACMCARREDLIAIGGADEDMAYLGHVCGPYEMTFRLMNAGRRLVWETEEYLYHTWHPGSDGVDNYLGPHDGRNMSTAAYQALCSGRIPPLVENEAIRRLRTEPQTDKGGREPAEFLIDPKYREAFKRQNLGGPAKRVAAKSPAFASYHGYDMYRVDGAFYAVPDRMTVDLTRADWHKHDRVIRGDSFTAVRDTLDLLEARLVETVGLYNICETGNQFAVVPTGLGTIDFRVRSHRENPAIEWEGSLAAARGRAEELTARAIDDGDLAVGQPWQASHSSKLPPGMWDTGHLEHRIGALERKVSGIYQSLTWRALTKIGGVVLGAARILRGGG